MSRLGKQPVVLPSGVEATYTDGTMTIKGPKGTLSRVIKSDVGVKIEDNTIILTPTPGSDTAKALWGTYASHLRNMVTGVTTGFTKVLELEGVGYRAEVKGDSVQLSVGFSHPVLLKIPEGVKAEVEKNVIRLNGIDNEVVGQFAADIRGTKKPEPYKGKGIRYQGEFIIRKQGKKAV
jgi:large subunit ribosomal protein L6